MEEREVNADQHKNNRRHQMHSMKSERQLLNQTLHSNTEHFFEVRLQVSIPNKSSGEHDFHSVSAIGLLKSYVPLPVY